MHCQHCDHWKALCTAGPSEMCLDYALQVAADVLERRAHELEREKSLTSWRVLHDHYLSVAARLREEKA